MAIEYDWYLSNENTVIHCISIFKYHFSFNDVYMCLVQYVCYCIIYILIIRLIKSLLEEQSAK